MKKKSWEREVQCQKRSGESVIRYCRERGLAVSTFRYWAKKLEGSELREERFVEVGQRSQSIEIISPSGMILRVNSGIGKSELKELIACLS